MNISKFVFYGFKVINIASISIAIKEYFFDLSLHRLIIK